MELCSLIISLATELAKLAGTLVADGIRYIASLTHRYKKLGRTLQLRSILPHLAMWLKSPDSVAAWLVMPHLHVGDVRGQQALPQRRWPKHAG